ncbi:hypothetical protein ACFL13_01490 [Patescibacteria group bacterium]
MSKLRKVTDAFGITDPYANQAQPAMSKPEPIDLGPKEILFQWEMVPIIPSNTINPSLKKTLSIIGIVIALLLVIMQEFWLILVVASLFFVTRVMTDLPQQTIKYEISTYGISVNGELYPWGIVKHFFFSGSYGHEVLVVDAGTGITNRMHITFKPEDKEKIKSILGERTTFLESEPQTVLDTTYRKVLDKFDLEGKKS